MILLTYFIILLNGEIQTPVVYQVVNNVVVVD